MASNNNSNSSNDFYVNFPQSPVATVSSTNQSMWSPHDTDIVAHWPPPFTSSGEISAVKTENATSTSERNAAVNDINDTNTSACSVTAFSGGMASPLPASGEPDMKKKEVKLPKNAVELIVWAITACHSTTPTLTEIASHIHSMVPAYRDHDLSTLIKMVQHHLHKNNPTFFLPVMSPAGHIFHNPSMAKWAINLQAVVVGEDGSVTRRRHRSHAYKNSTPSTPNRSAPRSTPQLYMSPPDGASGTCSPHQFQMYSSTPTGFSNAATPYSTAGYLPYGTSTLASGHGTTMNMLGTTTCSWSSGYQPPISTGLYGVPLGRGNVGKMPTARSQNSMAYQYGL